MSGALRITLCQRTAPARSHPRAARCTLRTRAARSHGRVLLQDPPGRGRPSAAALEPEVLRRFGHEVVKQLKHDALDLAAACSDVQCLCSVSTGAIARPRPQGLRRALSHTVACASRAPAAPERRHVCPARAGDHRGRCRRSTWCARPRPPSPRGPARAWRPPRWTGGRAPRRTPARRLRGRRRRGRPGGLRVVT